MRSVEDHLTLVTAAADTQSFDQRGVQLSIARRDEAPYDHPRLERTSFMSREVKVPPKTALATSKGM